MDAASWHPKVASFCTRHIITATLAGNMASAPEAPKAEQAAREGVPASDPGERLFAGGGAPTLE